MTRQYLIKIFIISLVMFSKPQMISVRAQKHSTIINNIQNSIQIPQNNICTNIDVQAYNVYSLQCESKKIPPEDLWQYFQNGWEFFNQILCAYYAFPSTLDYEFLFKYLQVWRNYAILSVTTQLKSCAQNVHHQPKRIFW